MTRKHCFRPLSLLRAASQILFFLFLPGLYISAFSGLKEIVLSLYNHSFSFTALLPQTVEAIAIIPVTMLIGRFFCGWMCAFGAMEDFISGISHKIFKRRFRINEKADRLLKYVKYLWLVLLVAGIWRLSIKTFSAFNPWDAFGMLLTPGSLPDFTYVAAHLAPALFLLLLIIGASFFIDRFFCRYLCPLGAFFALVSKLRITSIRKPRDGCGKCRACTSSCPMGIALYQKDSSRSSECIQCFRCVSACPRKNCRLAVAGSDVNPAVAGVMAAAAITGIYCVGSFASGAQASASGTLTGSSSVSQSASQPTESTAANSETASASQEPSSSAASASSSDAASGYKDGTYQGSGTGYRGQTTTISVTVSGGKITDISLLSTGDDPSFFNRAYSVVTQSILESQSTDVDAVSGATYSSNGIMQAVADALTKAQ